MRQTLLIYITILIIGGANAQPVNAAPKHKFGKISQKELTMDYYEPDSTACAVYLIRNGNTHYVYRDGFRLLTDYWVRVKVLTQEGTDYANVEIPYYAPDDKLKPQDEVTSIEGYSYNLENGKIVTQAMDGSLIADERVTPLFKVAKFSLPNVKAGTVFEYKYTVQSNYIYQIESWQMQHRIPLAYSEYIASIPNIFIFNIETRGAPSIKVRQKEVFIEGENSVAGSFTTGSADLTILGKEYSFVSQDIPALHPNEPFCRCPEDHRVQIVFELQGTNWPQEGYKAYSKSWADVDHELVRQENERFGKWLEFQNPFLEETKKQGTGVTDVESKIILAFRILKSQLAWNGEYRLLCEDMDKVLKEKNGSNADLNFVLMSILRSLGVQAYPVVMRRRSTGVLPMYFPTLQRLNTFAVAIYHPTKKEYVYLDSSMRIPATNVLPNDLCVEKARLLRTGLPEEERWVNLSDIIINRCTTHIVGLIDSLHVSGHRTTYLTGKYAADYFEKHQAPADKTDTQEADTPLTHVQVDFKENNFTALQEQADFVCPLDGSGERLYVNPMIFVSLKTNPFTQVKRTLPIEFDYPYQVTQTCQIEFPEDYEVEELPTSQRIKTEDGALSFAYLISYNQGSILLQYTLSVKSATFPAESYKVVQQIWDKAVECNNAFIVLKRKKP